MINWLEQEFVSAFSIDDSGRGNLVITETTTSGDLLVTIKGKYAGTSTPNSTMLPVTLPWAIGDDELWAVEAYVTAKSADCAIRQRMKISALVYGVGSTATLDAAPTVVADGTGTATATLAVSGSGMVLQLTPTASTPLVWGFEVRAQKL